MGLAPRHLLLDGCVIDLDRSLSRIGEDTHDLTHREVELLEYLSGRAGRAVSKEQIERDVWQMSSAVSSRAVSQAILRLRSKIEADPKNPKNLRTVHGVGWCLNHTAPTPSPRTILDTGQIPAAMNRFVGRVEERRRIRDLLRWGARLVTLVGPGGVGKSRLASEVVAALRRERYIAFCDLQSARDATDVAETIGRKLGFDPIVGRLGEQLVSVASRRGNAVLVLDNVEKVLPCVRELVESCLVPQAPVLLVTSREALAHDAEHRVALEPLPVPESGSTWGQALESPAMQLLLDRTTALFDGPTPTEAEQQAAIQLVRALGGSPLAIELAAARIRLLGTHGLLQRLHEFPNLLRRPQKGAGGPRDGIFPILEGAWEQLGPESRSALIRAAAFAGSLDLDAAIRTLFPGSTEHALDHIQSLVQLGLLRTTTMSRRTRVELPLVVRHFLDRVVPPESPQRRQASRVHAEMFARRWPSETRARLQTGHDRRLLGELESSLSDLRLAAERAARQNDKTHAIPCGLTAAIGLKRAGDFAGGLSLIKSLLRLSSLSPADEYELGIERARFEYLSGQLRESMNTARRSIQLARRLRDRVALRRAQEQYAMSAALAGDHDTSLQVLTATDNPTTPDEVAQSLRVLVTQALAGEASAVRDPLAAILRTRAARQDPALEIAGWCVLGAFSGRARDRRQAVSNLTRLRPALGSHLDATDRTLALTAYAVAQAELGNLDESSALLVEAIDLQRIRTSPPFLGLAVSLHALMDAERGNARRALKWLQEAEMLPCRESPTTAEWMALARSRVHIVMGELETGRCWLEEVLAQQPDSHSYARLRAHLYLSQLALDPRSADQHVSRALATAQQLGGGGFMAPVFAAKADLARRRGSLLDAITDATHAVQIARRDSPGLDLAYGLAVLARCQREAGMFDDAVSTQQECRGTFIRLGLTADCPVRRMLPADS